jgi:hypothetical protein
MRIKFFIALFSGLLVLCFSAGAASAFNPLGEACKTGDASTSPTCAQNAAQNTSKTNPTIRIIRTAANILAVVAGVAGVIIVIYSGFMFVTAGGAAPGQRSGDPNRIKSARAALTGAIIGLVIIALAWTIVAFVTDRLVNT